MVSCTYCHTNLLHLVTNPWENRVLLVFSGIFTFLVDAYPIYAASSLAANSFARSSFAGKRAHCTSQVLYY